MFFLLGTIFFHATVYAHVEQPKDLSGIGIDQRLGQTIPLDLTFSDENGRAVSLKELIHTPTILAPVYYSCPNVCSFLLSNLAGTLNKLPAEPGREYHVITLSFDENEKPDLALEKKRMYHKMIEKPFPEDTWRFLTGDKENIHKLTDAIGFHFKRQGKDFEHPVTLVILSQEGKITRYIYGTDFLPFDLKMALLEASEERVGPTVSKVLRFCFSYDPKGRKYVFNTLKVTGIVTLLFALSFILFLVFKGKKKPKQMVLFCFIIPFSILAVRRTRSILGTSIASGSILIGMWLERFLIIIPTLSQPRLPYERGSYMPSWVEWSMMAGLCAGFILAIILFSKFFPMISIWEMEKEAKERDEKLSKEAANSN